MSALRKFSEWWHTPEFPVPLGVFRIAVAAFCFLRLGFLAPIIFDLYGQFGFVQWPSSRERLTRFLPHMQDIAELLRPLGFSADETVGLVIVIFALACTGMLLGIGARFMAAVAWMSDYLLLNAAIFTTYGVDLFTHVALLFCVLMPTGNGVSLPTFFGWKKSSPLVSAGVTRKLLKLHLVIMYVLNGIWKAVGIEWWNGEAIWKALNLPIYSQFDFTWMAWYPWIPMLIGWSTLVLETGYGLAVWFKPTRTPFLLCIVCMHIGIGVFMGLWLFALIMVILNLGAFGPEIVTDVCWVYRRIRQGHSH
jgi:hypothetical protein